MRIFPPHEETIRRLLTAASALKKKRGRPPLPSGHYRDVALEYLRLYEDGSRSILKEIASKRGIPRQTVRDWVSRARELDYLTPGKQGRADARPGPKLLAELAAGDLPERSGDSARAG